jgi:hypothetical protein
MKNFHKLQNKKTNSLILRFAAYAAISALISPSRLLNF